VTDPHLSRTLQLPSPPPAAPPTPFPLVSAVVPVVGAGILWMITGSAYVLWFAALGPLVAVAGLLDGRRGSRRTQRRGAREVQAATVEVRSQLRRVHDDERRERWLRHPDVAAHMRSPDDIWRTIPGRREGLVVGSGDGASEAEVAGGDDSPGVRRLRADAARVRGVPVVVPRDAGIAVVGPRSLAEAVIRAWVLQLCLNSPPTEVRLGSGCGAWAHALPHARSSTGDVVAVLGATPHDVAPSGPLSPQMVFAVVGLDQPPPPMCTAVLTLTSPTTGRLVYGERTHDLELEGVSVAQAAAVTEVLDVRARAWSSRGPEQVPTLREIRAVRAPISAPRGSLEALIGVSAGAPTSVDLVVDGPHAVVIGVTGSGKSELLTTWVASLAAAYGPQEVGFLLVDFKGGRTFDALLPLPHVTGVLTDLDEAAALRAIQSLRAEVRHRERVLATHGARHVDEAGGSLARLVVVVDEYAALVAAHPSLHELFADLAARGRALGIHLILASQRAAGVFRDAVLANAPLRLALRVTDAADSRAVLGVDDAAALPGGAQDAGRCLIRGGGDRHPRTVRIVVCPPDEVRALAAQGPPARRPWMPPLAERIGIDEVQLPAGRLTVGLADDPEHQRQQVLALGDDEPGLVVLGAAGSGKSAVARLLTHQASDTVVVPSDPEEGWDALARAERCGPGALIVFDDLDLLLARLPHDYSAAFGERAELLAREARARRVRLVVTAQRRTAAVGRVADAIPQRLVLAQASRADHVAAGGEGRDFARLPPGRGFWQGLVVQTLWVEPTDPTGPADPAELAEPEAASRPWNPGRRPVAYVAPGGAATRTVLEAWRTCGVTIRQVDEPECALEPGCVVWGTPQSWLGQWRMLAAARSQASMIIDTSCLAEYRAITGTRELPPYAAPHAERAWRWTPGGAERIRLPR
jgi:S-DNA-T family DNA segregation ATPase FtsK/SpoIIIE